MNANKLIYLSRKEELMNKNIVQFNINGYGIEIDTMGYNAYDDAIKNGILIKIDQNTKITLAIVEKITGGGLDQYTKGLVSSMWNSVKTGDKIITTLGPSDFDISTNPKKPNSFFITSKNKISGKISIRYLEQDGKKMCSIFAFYKENDENAINVIKSIKDSIHIEKLNESQH